MGVHPHPPLTLTSLHHCQLLLQHLLLQEGNRNLPLQNSSLRVENGGKVILKKRQHVMSPEGEHMNLIQDGFYEFKGIFYFLSKRHVQTFRLSTNVFIGLYK